MNNTIKELFERKSTRTYLDKEISIEDKKLILQAATQAPSAGNMQLYSIIDVTDQKIKDDLAILCDNQPFVAKAKMVLIFLADYSKWYDAFNNAGCGPRNLDVGDLQLSTVDAVIACQNAIVAAQSLGIGSCYIGDIIENHDDLVKLLDLPNHVVPACMAVFGYPAENELKVNKPNRVDLKYTVFENKYHQLSKQEIEDMFKDKKGLLELDEYLTRFCKRKYNTDFSINMSKSYQKYIDEYKK